MNRSDTAVADQVWTATSATLSDFQAAGGGSWNLIKTVDSTGASDVSFVDGVSSVVFDGTYNCYCIIYTAVNPSTNNTDFEFNFTDDAASSYAVSKTQFGYTATVSEAGSGASPTNTASFALGNGTGNGRFAESVGGDADECASGWFYVWNPASTVHVKMYSAQTNMYHAGNSMHQNQVGGYANTTSAIDGIKFLPASGTFDTGSWTLYGLSK